MKIKIIFLCIEIFLKISIISTTNNKILILPLIKKDDSYLSKSKNMTEVIQFIFSEQLIAELNIGTPEQKSHIFIRADESNIYLTQKNHNSSVYDEITKTVYSKYKNINYFNNEETNTIEYNETFKRTFFFNNFKEWKISNDYLNIISNKNKIKLDFVLVSFILYEDPGCLGLLPEEKTSVNQFTLSFLYQLKQNNIIENYKWFIYYGEKNKKDYLILGCSPHEFIIPDTGKYIFPNLDYDKDYNNINDEIFVDRPKREIIFDDIFITSNISTLEKDDSFKFYNKNGFLKVDLGVIIGSYEYHNYIKDFFFKDYLYNKKCFNATFKQRLDFLTQTFYHYYCEDSLYNDIKTSFKPLVFKKVELSEFFILTFNDLFIRTNGYLIFLVVFTNNYKLEWDLGAPFLRKYQFVYDYGNKQIGYYHDRYRKEKEEERYEGDDETDKDKNKKKYKYLIYVGYILLIIILSSLLIGLGFLLGKKIYKIRKKRANELSDDDYEYKESGDNNNTINE